MFEFGVIDALLLYIYLRVVLKAWKHGFKGIKALNFKISSRVTCNIHINYETYVTSNAL